MKFKKTALILSVLFAPLTITSCGQNPEVVEFENKTHTVYELAKEAGFNGTYEEWLESIKGEAGKDGLSITSIIQSSVTKESVTYQIILSDGSSKEITIPLVKGDKGDTGETGPQGEKGDKGDQGEVGPQGPQGEQGISVTKIIKTKTEGLVDTYLIVYSNGETGIFTVTNGKDGLDGEQGIKGEKGDDGHTPVVEIGTNGNWVIDGVDTNIKAQGPKGDKGDQGETGPQGPQGDKGETGVSIVSIKKTKTEGLIDTYTITYSDGTEDQFTVTNGKDGAAGPQGEKGETGAQGEQGIQGEKGEQGIQGIPGKDGHTPVVKIDDNGNWIVDGVDTNIKAQGPKGDKGDPGKDGVDGLTPHIGENGHWWIGKEDTGKQAEGKDGAKITSIVYSNGDLYKKEYIINFSDGTSYTFAHDFRTDYDSKEIYGLWVDSEGYETSFFLNRDETATSADPKVDVYTIFGDTLTIHETYLFRGDGSDETLDIIKDRNGNIVALKHGETFFVRPNSKSVHVYEDAVTIDDGNCFVTAFLSHDGGFSFSDDRCVLKDLQGIKISNIEYDVKYQIDEDPDNYYYFQKGDANNPYIKKTISKIAGAYTPTDPNCIIKKLYISKTNKLIVEYNNNYIIKGLNKDAEISKISGNKYLIKGFVPNPNDERFNIETSFILNIDNKTKTFSDFKQVTLGASHFGYTLTNDTGNFKLTIDPINHEYKTIIDGITTNVGRFRNDMKHDGEPIVQIYDSQRNNVFEYDYKNNTVTDFRTNTTYNGITVSNVSWHYYNELNGKYYEILPNETNKIHIDNVAYDCKIDMSELYSKITFANSSLKPIRLKQLLTDSIYNNFADLNDQQFDELASKLASKTFMFKSYYDGRENEIKVTFDNTGRLATSVSEGYEDDDFEGIYPDKILNTYDIITTDGCYYRDSFDPNRSQFYAFRVCVMYSIKITYMYFVYKNGELYVGVQDGNLKPLTEVPTK